MFSAEALLPLSLFLFTKVSDEESEDQAGKEA